MKINTVVLELTNKCNQHCIYCSGGNHSTDCQELSFEREWKVILEKLADYHPNRVILSGGEPFLYTEFQKLYLYSLEMFPYVGITTNGTSLSAELFELLKENLPASIQISLDGSEEYHNEMRGKNTYQKCINTAKRLLSIGCNVFTMTVVTKKNLPYLQSFIRDMRRIGIKSMGFERLSPVGNGKQLTNLLLDKEELLTLSQIIAENQCEYANCSCNDPMINSLKYEKGKVPKVYLPLDGCMAGIQNYAIDAEGYLKICTRVPIRIGAFLSLDLDSIHWNYPLLKALTIRNFGGKCGKCEKLMICGGCRAEAYGLTGNVLAEDISCID